VTRHRRRIEQVWICRDLLCTTLLQLCDHPRRVVISQNAVAAAAKVLRVEAEVAKPVACKNIVRIAEQVVIVLRCHGIVESSILAKNPPPNRPRKVRNISMAANA
jgi:hypothetical protein